MNFPSLKFGTSRSWINSESWVTVRDRRRQVVPLLIELVRSLGLPQWDVLKLRLNHKPEITEMESLCVAAPRGRLWSGVAMDIVQLWSQKMSLNLAPLPARSSLEARVVWKQCQNQVLVGLGFKFVWIRFGCGFFAAGMVSGSVVGGCEGCTCGLRVIWLLFLQQNSWVRSLISGGLSLTPLWWRMWPGLGSFHLVSEGKFFRLILESTGSGHRRKWILPKVYSFWYAPKSSNMAEETEMFILIQVQFL
jgi:hypothetical protein